MLVNGQAGRPDGKCNRKTPPALVAGKGEMVR
jgi:hypothetical protein